MILIFCRAVVADDLDLLPRRRSVHADQRLARLLGRFAVRSQTRDRHFENNAVDVGAAEAIDAEGILAVVGVFRGAQERQRLAPQIGGVEHRAEIDIESLGALAGENFDAGRRIGENSLGRELFVLRHGRRADVGRHGDQSLALVQLGAFFAAHLGHRVGLAPGQPFGAGSVETGDALRGGDRNARIADVGEGKFELAEKRPVLGFEAKLVDDVFRPAVEVVIDVEAVEHLVVEVEIVRPVGGILAGDDVHDEDGFSRILPAPKRVGVGVVRRGIERDQRRFAMARGARRRRRQGHDRRQRHRKHFSETW